MTRRASTVHAYLQSVPAARRPALVRLRRLCREILRGYDETMLYDVPTYTRDGVPEISFANQKDYISFYVVKPSVIGAYRHHAHYREQFRHAGKGTLRFSKPADIDFALIEKLLHDTQARSLHVHP